MPWGRSPPATRRTTPSPGVEAFDGTFAGGLAEVARLSGEEQYDEALDVLERLLVPGRLAGWRAALERQTHGKSEAFFGAVDRPLAWLGFESLPESDRAELHFARGVVQARAGDGDAADEAFELARALAGPGETRQDAVYDLGTLDLQRGEVLRAEIPEIAGQAAAAPGGPLSGPPGGPSGPTAGSDEEPDPLVLARAAYRAAKEHFVEQLRSDWRDADCRANVELVMPTLSGAGRDRASA